MVQLVKRHDTSQAVVDSEECSRVIQRACGPVRLSPDSSTAVVGL
jgi:hypothetical protein